MLESYRTIYQGGESEVTEKKSRFIGNVKMVECEEEAQSFLEEVRKHHWNARHHCYAFVIGENNELTRCSDDGEPSGTGGRPILDVLLGENLRNGVIVVTRYFGGTLLGTGGLVRAYGKAAQEAMKASIVIEKQRAVKLQVTTDYNGVGKMQHLAAEQKVPVLDTEYTDIVKIEILVPISRTDAFCKAVTELTKGRARIEKNEEVYFSEIAGEYQLFSH